MLARSLRALLALFSLMSGVSALADTAILQQSATYSGTTDAWLFSGTPDTNNDAASGVLRSPTTALLLRFAIFASEGGPVPDGATINSATLSLYKFNSPDGVFNAKRVLRTWQETQATWNSAATGSAWATPGATGTTDVTSANEAQMSVGVGPMWGDFNVTTAVQAMANGNNFGWRLQHIGGDTGPHEFYASEAAGSNAAFRPKLVVDFSVQTQASKTLMQGLNGYTGTTDNRIARGAPTTNAGEAASYNLIRESDTSLLVRFGNIFVSEGGEVPDNATITSATLSLYKYFGAAATFKASRLKKDWNESQATWNEAATGTSWTAAGAMGLDTDYLATPDGQAPIGDGQADGCGTTPAPAACWLNIDVTAGVQAFKANPAGNFGWKIAQVSTVNENSQKEFHSSESGAALGTLRPTLTISYTTSGQPGAPTANFTWSQVPGTLNVQFNAANSQPNGATITELRLRFGHGSPEAEDTWADKDQVRTHTFPGAGTYAVKLTARNSAGLSQEYTSSVTVTEGSVPAEKFPSPRPASGVAVPTFHSMSLYFNGDGAPPAGQEVFVRYRRATENPINPSVWKEALPLFYDTRTTNPRCTGGCGLPHQWRGRGSVLHLQPGTEYVFEVATGTSHATADWDNSFRIPDPLAADPRYPSTWPDPLPENATFEKIPSQTSTYIITGAGTPGAYKVYDGCKTYQQGKCIDKEEVNRGGNGVVTPFSAASPANDTAHAIIVRANYVIVRNVVARGAALSGIYVAPGVTNVVIEDSEVFDWAYQPGYSQSEPSQNSWTGSDYWGAHQTGGIHLGGNNSRVVVQRNVIREPHYGAFPWDTGQVCSPDGTGNHHPLGPNGISVYSGNQQNVIRYNQITGHPTNKKLWMMDGIGGQENFSTTGSPGADSDIYQNLIMNVFDDAIEAEGGGRNVRIWGNYMSDTMVAVAATTTHYGPHYVWRNVVNHIRRCHQAVTTNTDNDWFAQAFKYGGLVFNNDDHQEYGDGRRYLFNNTLLQEPIGTYGEGAGRGIESVDYGSGSVKSTIARNNIFHVRSSTHAQAWSMELGTGATDNTFTHNLFNGRYSSTVTPQPDLAYEFGAGTGRELQYKGGHGYGSVPGLGDDGSGAGDYQLSDTSFGRRMGTQVPNITRDIDGLAGARKSGFEPATGVCDASSSAGCPDPGAHQNGSTQSMKFGIKAGQ